MSAADPQSTKFGELLYQIKSEPEGSCIYKERVVVMFYEAVVIVQTEQKFMCYKQAFQQDVLPKYKINGISVSKSQVPIPLICFGFWALIAGISLLAADEAAYGIILLIIGLLCVVIPYFMDTYYVHIALSQPKEFGIAKLIKEVFAGCLPASDAAKSYVIRCSYKPDSDKLMDYAYGNIAGNMDKMHALSHLIQDDISEMIKPNSLADVA